jgi:Protein of unknown function (DUF2948)
MADARFEDGETRPLNLVARDVDDLAVISALVQDAVLTAGDIRYTKSKRRFVLLINRFRWEDGTAQKPERVRSLLVFDDVTLVQGQGVDRNDPDLVLSLLSLGFAPREDGTGVVTLTFAGDGALALGVEALDVALKDVTRPYLAPSRHIPKHPE